MNVIAESSDFKCLCAEHTFIETIVISLAKRVGTMNIYSRRSTVSRIRGLYVPMVLSTFPAKRIQESARARARVLRMKCNTAPLLRSCAV